MQNTENKFKNNGLWYIAVEEDSCRGCEFQYCWPNVCVDLPQCTNDKRKDNCNVIFVRSDVDNLGGEE